MAAAARGVCARRHSRNSSASVRMGRNANRYGANPNREMPPRMAAASQRMTVVRNRLSGGIARDQYRMYPPTVRAHDFERQVVDRHLVAALGNPAETLQQQTADRVVLVIAEPGGELRVEVI